MMGSEIGFLCCAAIIFFAGQKLSLYGDKIAEKTGLGKAWIGLILMASVTSLPELVTGISASALVQSPDLAVGNILGSCTFNLATLAMLDLLLPPKTHLFYLASSRHVLSAALGTVLMALIGIGLFLPAQVVILPGIGVMSVAFLVIYLFSIRLIYRFEMAGKIAIEAEEVKEEDTDSLRQLVLWYALFALLIIAAALFIPFLADNIAAKYNLSKTFVGTVIVAASTVLPEIAVSVAAVRMGSVDLAVGNLLGSNIFNALILVVDDICYTRGVLLKDASDNHIVSAFSVVLMTAIAIAGFTYRSPVKKFFMALDAILILLFYFLNMVLLYYLSIKS